jgi:hypothetical protein
MRFLSPPALGILFLFSFQLLFGQDDTSQKIDSPQVSPASPASPSSPSGPSNKLSADIYEKDANEDKKSLSSKVNFIREMGEIEVFFDGQDKGPYILKEGPNLGLYKDRLIKSQKSKELKVNVKVEKDYIVSVELSETKEKPKDSKSDVESVLDSVFKK